MLRLAAIWHSDDNSATNDQNSGVGFQCPNHVRMHSLVTSTCCARMLRWNCVSRLKSQLLKTSTFGTIASVQQVSHHVGSYANLTTLSKTHSRRACRLYAAYDRVWQTRKMIDIRQCFAFSSVTLGIFYTYPTAPLCRSLNELLRNTRQTGAGIEACRSALVVCSFAWVDTAICEGRVWGVRRNAERRKNERILEGGLFVGRLDLCVGWNILNCLPLPLETSSPAGLALLTAQATAVMDSSRAFFSKSCWPP